ncbi:Hemerythrin HHE cation binding protein, partial [human gut metagenome]
ICAENFSKEDWYQIYKDTAQYEDIFGVTRIAWPEADAALAAQTTKPSGDNNAIGLIGGTLTVDQLDAMHWRLCKSTSSNSNHQNKQNEHHHLTRAPLICLTRP